MRLGMWPKKMLSGLKLLNPLRMESTFQSIQWIGYLALECFIAATWPRMTEEANFTSRTNRTASVITTLEVGEAVDDTRQNEFLELFTLILTRTPLRISLSWKNMYISYPRCDFLWWTHSEFLAPCLQRCLGRRGLPYPSFQHCLCKTWPWTVNRFTGPTCVSASNAVPFTFVILSFTNN